MRVLQTNPANPEVAIAQARAFRCEAIVWDLRKPCLRASAMAARAGLDSEGRLQVARDPVASYAHPEWMYCPQHHEWLRRFPGFKGGHPALVALTRARPWGAAVATPPAAAGITHPERSWPPPLITILRSSFRWSFLKPYRHRSPHRAIRLPCCLFFAPNVSAASRTRMALRAPICVRASPVFVHAHWTTGPGGCGCSGEKPSRIRPSKSLGEAGILTLRPRSYPLCGVGGRLRVERCLVLTDAPQDCWPVSPPESYVPEVPRFRVATVRRMSRQ